MGQFLTPERTAEFMASLFPDGTECCRLLDAGAGIGSLSAAFLERWLKGDLHFKRIEIDAFEIDNALIKHLTQTLNHYNSRDDFICNIHEEDFIHASVASLSGNLFSKPLELYTHAILNPPYRKINSDSAYRLALRRVGIETVNLYSAFVALATALSAPGGQIVAIIPRSFCNGPYYRPFREFILKRTAIRHMHLHDVFVFAAIWQFLLTVALLFALPVASFLFLLPAVLNVAALTLENAVKNKTANTIIKDLRLPILSAAFAFTTVVTFSILISYAIGTKAAPFVAVMPLFACFQLVPGLKKSM